MVDVVTEANTNRRYIEALQILNEQTGRNIPQSDIYNLLYQYNFTGAIDYWDVHHISDRFRTIIKELSNQKQEDRKKKLIELGFTTCRRCGGSGKYSWNPKTHDQCFACGGSGVVPKKKKEGAGWHGDTPGHKAAAVKADTKDILRTPLESGKRFKKGDKVQWRSTTIHSAIIDGEFVKYLDDETVLVINKLPGFANWEYTVPVRNLIL